MPQITDTLTNQAFINALQDASRHAANDEWPICLKLCRQVLDHDDSISFANYLAGIASIKLGARDEAISYLLLSVELKEHDTNKLSILCGLLIEDGRTAEAIHYLKLWADIERTPDVLNHLGAIHADAGHIGEAISYFRESLSLLPKGNAASAGLYPLLRITCEWGAELTQLSKDIDRLNETALSQGLAAPEPPFDNVHRVEDPKKNYLVAKSWSDRLERNEAVIPSASDRKYNATAKQKIRIGYISGDLHDHAIGHLTRGVFRAHERSSFEIYAYSHSPNKLSAYQEDIRLACDAFVDIGKKSDTEAAEIIRNDNINILIDLMGYTRKNRLEICAKRPAPVQVTYLGFPGTTGANFFDYILVDEIVAPFETACYFSEAPVYLPGAYQPNDNTQIKINKITEQYNDIKNNFKFLFSSFNNPIKINKTIFEVWLNLLKLVPESGLWVLQNNLKAEQNLLQTARTAGIEPERLIFGKMLPRTKHLERMAVADLGLDTYPYNGHTTTSDALWAGLPIVTMQGNHFASRVSTSLLNAAGIPELVTKTIEQYSELAYRLATNAEELAYIRSKIATKRSSCALFDTTTKTRNLEIAYKEMWRRYVQNEMVSAIDLTTLQ